MTRINSAIDPKNLIDQHLIAELRELNYLVIGESIVEWIYQEIKLQNYYQRFKNL